MTVLATLAGIEYRLLTPDQDENVRQLYAAAMLENPGWRAMTSEINDLYRVFDEVLKNAFSYDLSIGAFDLTTEELVGIRLSVIETRKTIDSRSDVTKKYKSDFTAMLAIRDSEFYADIGDFFEEESAAVHFVGLAVKPSYRKRGIARHLVLEALKRCKSTGYKIIIVETSHESTEKLYFDLNFKLLAKRPLDSPLWKSDYFPLRDPSQYFYDCVFKLRIK